MTGTTDFIKSGEPQTLGGFIETESATAMLRSLRRARAKTKVTMITGAPGVGKSATIEYFIENECYEAIVFQATAGEGGEWNLGCALYDLLRLGVPNARDRGETRREIADTIGPNGFLIIDEAQYLVQRNMRGADSWDCLEWVRSMSEYGGFGMAFVGDLTLDSIVYDLPQLKRRTHPRLTLTHVTARDADIFCKANGLTDGKTIKTLARVAKSFGGLGDLAEIFATAKDMNGDKLPTPDDIHASLELLGFKKGV